VPPMATKCKALTTRRARKPRLVSEDNFRHTLAVPRRNTPESRDHFAQRGRGECRVPGAPAASCAHRVASMHTSIHSEVAKITRHPHAMVYGLWRALPGDRAVLPPSLAEVAFRKLDASVEASEPHVFAVRFCAVRYRRIHVHRISPRVRDDREPPLRWDETG
jgi:hypothetical protein